MEYFDFSWDKLAPDVWTLETTIRWAALLLISAVGGAIWTWAANPQDTDVDVQREVEEQLARETFDLE